MGSHVTPAYFRVIRLLPSILYLYFHTCILLMTFDGRPIRKHEWQKTLAIGAPKLMRSWLCSRKEEK